MIKNISIFLLTVLFICVTNIENLSNSIEINLKSINLVKNHDNTLLQNVGVIQDDCHFYWFSFMNDYLNGSNFYKNIYLSEIMNCSKTHLDMLHALFPDDSQISQKVNDIYPGNKEFMYWLLDSSENDPENSKNILFRILELDDEDAVAWRRLGSILWKQTEYTSGLQAYLNACTIDDLASNGCYYVGASYKAMGDLEKAIYYFRLSYWSPSWEIADQLEAELSSKN